MLKKLKSFLNYWFSPRDVEEAFEEAWQEYKKHGQGTMAYQDGSRYVGSFHKDKAGKVHTHGQGTLTSPEGKYVGQWQNGNMHGQGTVTSPDGTKYVGKYKDGEKNGQGTYTFPDGAKYVGNTRTARGTGREHLPGQMEPNPLGSGRTVRSLNSPEFVEHVRPKTEPVPVPEP